MKISKCKYQSVARVVLEEEEGREHKVTMFGGIIEKITDISKEFEGGGDGEDMSGLLLLSPELSYTINTRKETVCSVTRDVETT